MEIQLVEIKKTGEVGFIPLNGPYLFDELVYTVTLNVMKDYQDGFRQATYKGTELKTIDK